MTLLCHRLPRRPAFPSHRYTSRRFISHLRDIRQSKQFHQVQNHFRSAFACSFGKPSTASQPSICATKPLVAVKVGIRDSLEANPIACISIINTNTGHEKIIKANNGEQCASPKWSPRGHQLAYLSDQSHPGVMGLIVLDSGRLDDHSVSSSGAPMLAGTAESFSWSPDSRFLLIQVAEHGADQSAAHGSDRMGSHGSGDDPDWLPSVDATREEVG